MGGTDTQEALRIFVKSFVKGRTLSVQGGLTDCLVTLDRRVTKLSLQRAGKPDAKKRGILLEEIAEVYAGNEVEQDFDVELPGMDDLTATLLLDSGQAVGFHFEDITDRESFRQCLAVLAE